AQASGLSLIEIQVILELRDEGESTCGHTVRLLESHLEDVQTQIIDLHRTKTLLEKMIVKAKALDPVDCLNPNRCQTISATHLQMEGTGTE
ncbi:MAG: MerR family DNA-binding protein, partial [Acidimicrobiia bacterium]